MVRSLESDWRSGKVQVSAPMSFGYDVLSTCRARRLKPRPFIAGPFLRARVSQPTEDRLRQVEERLRWVEERLAYLEARQAGPPPLPRGPAVQPKVSSGSVDASTASAMAVEKLDDFTEADWQRSLTPSADDMAPAPPMAAASVQPIESAGGPPPVVAPVMAYEPGPPQYRPQGTLRQPGEFERTVWLKWAGWFGAIVLVIGAGLAIKFAYDQGWLGHLPDVVKLMLMSLGGFGLIAAGEVVLRRVNRLSAVGLYGAGVAVLFLVGYAGYEWYDVYAQGTAFALMGVATLIGVLIAARADLVSIAVLSLIGGHIVPILLGEKSSSAVPLLSYLLLLQTLALSLCFLQATPKWWVLRSVSLAATSLWQLVMVVARADFPTDTVAASSVFAAIYWMLYQAELVLTTLRVERRQSDRPGLPSIVPGGLVFSIVVSALTILVLLAANDQATATVRGGIVLAAAGICAAAGFALWLTRREPLAGLSGSLRAQAAALLVLAVPVGLDAENVVFGLLALAIGFGLLAVARKLRISAIASIATWLLAIYALFWWVATSAAAQSPWLTLGGVAISRTC